jgi:hypothetical protein
VILTARTRIPSRLTRDLLQTPALDRGERVYVGSRDVRVFPEDYQIRAHGQAGAELIVVI